MPKMSKCEIGVSKVNYFGHVSNKGVIDNPRNIKIVVEGPTLKDKT